MLIRDTSSHDHPLLLLFNVAAHAFHTAYLPVTIAAFDATARSNPGIMASTNALRNSWPIACQVLVFGLVSFPVRSTSVATWRVLEFFKR